MKREAKFNVRKPWGIINTSLTMTEFIERLEKGEITDEWWIETEPTDGSKKDLLKIREFKRTTPWILDILAEGNSQKAKSKLEREQVQQQLLAEEKKQLARKSPAGDVLLQVRSTDGIEPGYYLVSQISQRLVTGSLPVSAEFRHPDYDEWFPCAPLISDENLKGIAELRKELIAMRGQLVTEITSLREQTEKVKWAARIGALAVMLILTFGFKVVMRW